MDIDLRESNYDQNQKSNVITKLKNYWSDLKYKLGVFFANPKKRLIFIISVGIVTIGLFGVGIYSMTHEKNPVTTEEENKEEVIADAEKKDLYEAPLDGIMTDKESANRHPLGVMIENHTDSRPQAGLNKASIVYEAIAEGGITRFLAIFGTKEAEKVGPVRSARTYYVDWIHGYDGYLAHVGGNMDALDKIKAEGILDLDQFAYSNPYHRESKAGIATEHTMYTNTIKLREQAEKNNYRKANNFNILRFKDDEVTEQDATLDPNATVSDTDSTVDPAYQGDAHKIQINYSQSAYNVYFEYDKATNSYKRFMGGAAHKDQISKEQINPKNIIVMTMGRSSTVTRINEPGWNMNTIGSGKAMIYLDGKEIEGTWKKNSASDRELFYDKTGNEIVFNRGQFWISVVHPDITSTVVK